ncbi:hypothetical protein N7540_002595 [Penicillium herquei]|nr:hypothetical protein N7540_002595 [Penicillium herquei]
MGFDQLESGSVESRFNELVEIVKERQKQCEGKFWSISVRGKTIVLRNYTTSIIDWVEKTGDIATQFAPTQIALSWSIIKFVLQIPLYESEQMAALLGTTEKIVRIICRGQVYEKIYLNQISQGSSDPVTKSLETGLVKIYATSLEILADAGILFSKNTARRTLEAIFHPEKASGALSDIDEQENQLLHDVQACENRLSVAADERVDHLLEYMEDTKRNKILEWISPIPFGKNHNRVKENRTPDTGDWIIHHRRFRRWKENSSSRLFWLQGSPGAGKTFLTSSVIDHIQDLLSDSPDHEGFAFFYCDRNDTLRIQALSVLQSFVSQLSTTERSPESIRVKLRQAYNLARSQGTDFQTILVIDAMDECSSEKRYRLIDALKYFILECKNTVKIFISSRPDSNIKSHLASVPSITISASHNHDDIKMFLDFELDRLAKDQGIQVLGRLKTEIMNKLLEKCQGMFQWAAMQVHQLKDCTTATNVREMLENLPGDLQASYDKVWTQIQALREPDQTLAKRALRWTMSSLRPLESQELLFIIRLGQDGQVLPQKDSIEEDSLISLCKNFIILDTESNMWRFAHISVLEYLKSKTNWTLPLAHHHAANVCLSHLINYYTYLTDSSVIPQNLPRNKPVLSANVSLQGSLLEDRDIEWLYEETNAWWMEHVHLAQDTEEKTLQCRLNAFLGPPENSTYQYQSWYQQFTNVELPEISLRVDTMSFCKDEYSRVVFEHLSPPQYSIFAICRFGLADVLESWRDSAGNISLSPERRWAGTALVSAAYSGHFEIVKYLVEMGADVNMFLGEKERVHDKALSAALCSGNVEIVTRRYLLERIDFDINTPFPKALKGSSVITRRRIAEWEDFEPQHKALYHGYAIGMAACAPGTELLKIILDAGADVNQSLGSKYWSSVLAIKIGLGEVDSVKFLVQEAGAAPDSPFEIGDYGNALGVAFCSKLSYGVSNCHEMIVEVLLKGGANTSMPLKYGRFGTGADVNMFLENSDFSTVITFAAALPRLARITSEIGRVLVRAGAELNPKGPVGRYGGALMAAAFFGEKRTVQYLIDAGADVNQKFEGIPYTTALQAAQSDFSEKDWEWVTTFQDHFGYYHKGTLRLKVEDHELKPWLKRRKDRVALLLKKNGAIA